MAGHFLFRSPLLGFQGKTYDWDHYAFVGLAFPILLFGVPLLWRWRGWQSGAASTVKRVLVVVTVAAFTVFIVASLVKHGIWSGMQAVVLALVQTDVMVLPRRSQGIADGRILAIFTVALVGWTVAFSLSLGELLQPPFFLAGFAVAFLLASLAARDVTTDEQRATFEPWTRANVTALAVIALMSLRTEGLFEVLGERGAIHHWGAWVGAAELVREGGWLLWDAPSMYGSLNVLAFALIPTTTPWQSFYLTQALAYFVVGGGLFLLFRAVRPGVLNWVFALAVAIAVPLFLPTYDLATPVASSFILPNFGAYRYIWAFIILAILLWERVTEERTPRHAVVLTVGCFAWVAGVLWSPESAFFCSGAWLPAYASIVMRTTEVGADRWRRAAAWFALPGVLLAAVLGLVVVAFAMHLRHLPDWASYLDYAREVGLNLLVVVQEPVGPAMGLVLAFCLLAIGAYYAGIRLGLPTRNFALWVSLLGAFWATNSYGYQRGLVLLHPVAYATLGVLLIVAARKPQTEPWNSLVRAGTVPLLVMPLISPLAAIVADPLAVRDAAASLSTTAQHRFEVEQFLPDVDADLQSLMAEAGVAPTDPIFFAGDLLGNYLLPWRPTGAPGIDRVVTGRHWVPAVPAFALRWIPEGRGAVYTSRFIERAQASGWLIQAKTGPRAGLDSNGYASGLEPWFFELISQTHVPTRLLENATWQLVWFEFVGDQAAVIRPEYAWSRLGPLPPDIFIDGKAMAGTAQPEMWTIFGEGWRILDDVRQARRAETRADLWIFSPTPRDVRVRLTPFRGKDGHALSVAVNSGLASPLMPLQSGQPVDQIVALQSGWNRVTFNTVPADATMRRLASPAPSKTNHNSRQFRKSGLAIAINPTVR